MKKDKKIIFIIYIIIIILLIICFFCLLINYINKRPQLTVPDTGKFERGVQEPFYEMAKTYCENNIGNFEGYNCIKNEYIESINSHILVFKKENDLLFIALTPNREVTAFTKLKQNELNKYTNIEIDNAKLNIFIENELKNKYGDNFKRFTEQERKLKIIDGKIILECSIETELKAGKPFFKNDIVLYLIGE